MLARNWRTCPLADALDRWLREVVQPRAKALLHANVIRLGNMSAYMCRNRYNSATERISYHAFAEALDVSEFVTAKGEHINVLEHWPVKDERSQFLRDVHDGACKIFSTVLGPEANEAHKNHFHLDMAQAASQRLLPVAPVEIGGCAGSRRVARIAQHLPCR